MALSFSLSLTHLHTYTKETHTQYYGEDEDLYGEMCLFATVELFLFSFTNTEPSAYR